MMRFVDTSLRRECASAITQRSNGLMSFRALEKRGDDLACLFGKAAQSFLCQAYKGREKPAQEISNSPETLHIVGQPPTAISSLREIPPAYCIVLTISVLPTASQPEEVIPIAIPVNRAAASQ